MFTLWHDESADCAMESSPAKTRENNYYRSIFPELAAGGLRLDSNGTGSHCKCSV